jgi:hypothetical protein
MDLGFFDTLSPWKDFQNLDYQVISTEERVISAKSHILSLAWPIIFFDLFLVDEFIYNKFSLRKSGALGELVDNIGHAAKHE